jgi:SdrD B-like domain
MELKMSGNRSELRDQTQQLLDGPLKHIRGAALAAALLPLASVAATPASAEPPKCASGGVCGTVFNDTNNNGVQDAGETGIENVQVLACQLCDGSDNTPGVTDMNGFYSIFVPGGTTKVFILVPAGVQASPPNVGDDAVDSDGVPTDNFSVGGVLIGNVSLASGLAADGTPTDFGFFFTQTVPLACTIPAASEVISPTSWNKFNVPAGPAPVAWVHAQFKPTGVQTTASSTVHFTSVSFVLNGISYAMPDGIVNFDPNAPATSTTTFSGTQGTPSALWTTTINPDFISDENFFVGAAIPVDPAIAGGGKATIRFTTQTDDTGLSFSWQWSAAVYTFWPSNWNQAMIQAYHGNGLHADTPRNTQVQKSLIQGPRGGGGSNFTGSWSATGHGACK